MEPSNPLFDYCVMRVSSDLMTASLDTAGLLSVFRELCLFFIINIRILGLEADLSTSFGMTDRWAWLAHAPQMYCFLPLLHCIIECCVGDCYLACR